MRETCKVYPVRSAEFKEKIAKLLTGLTNFFLFGFFCLGIVLGKNSSSFLIYFSLSLCLIIIFFIFHKKNKPFLSESLLLLFFLSVGGLWYISSSGGIERFLHRESEITLKVVSLPVEKTTADTFAAQIKKIDSYPVNLRVKVIDATRKLQYLGTYKFKTKLTKRRYKGRVFYSLWVKAKTSVQKLPPSFFDSAAKKTSNYILGVFKNNCSPQSYRFLGSVFLGRRELLSGEKEFFADAGVSHLLAISGLHIGLTCLILFFVLRFFNIRFRACLIISVVFLYFYTFLTGASFSTLRAAIMYSAFAFSFLLKRKTHPLNSLALAGFIIVLADVQAVFDIGFQLSFTSVLAIIFGFKIFKIKSAKTLALNYIKQMFFCSFFVTLFITPLVSYYFGRVYILSVFYNVVLIPFFTFILGINFLLLIFAPITFVGQSLGALISAFIKYFIDLVVFFGNLKLSFVNYSFGLKSLYIYYAFLAGILAIFILKKVSFSAKCLEKSVLI